MIFQLKEYFVLDQYTVYRLFDFWKLPDFWNALMTQIGVYMNHRLKVLPRKQISKSVDGKLIPIYPINTGLLILYIYIRPNDEKYQKKKKKENIYSPELLPLPRELAFQTKTRQIITPIFMPLFVALLVVYIFDLDVYWRPNCEKLHWVVEVSLLPLKVSTVLSQILDLHNNYTSRCNPIF